MPAAQSVQIARVLRLRAGDAIEVFDGAGGVARVLLLSVAPRDCRGAVQSVETRPWPWPWRATLCLSLVRPQRFEWAIEKAVELGAWAIQPLLTTRVQHGGRESQPTRLGRWQSIAIEAAEQCGSAYLPEIRAPLHLAAALRSPAALRLLPHTAADLARSTVVEALRTPSVAIGDAAAIFVGPEGGFTAEEVEAALQAGCRAVTLGPSTLRSETAALAALTLVNAGAAGAGGVT